MVDEPAEDNRLAARIQEILQEPDFPAFSEQIEETMHVLEDEEVSARRLAEIVVSNFGLTLKVLQAANSFGANPLGVTVFDVAQAVFRLGVERVRSMASGMVFFDHFHAKSGAVKQLVVLSLVTANQAEAAADRLGIEKPEEAYLCGMLRNMGEVLVASYFPGEYEAIQETAALPGTSLADACRKTLGFTYEELGVAVAERWKMPSAVAATMTCEPAASAVREPHVIQVAELAHRLTSALYRDGPGDSQTRVALVVERFAIPLGLSKENIQEIANGAAAAAQKTFAKLNVPTRDVEALDQKRVAQAFGKGKPARPAPARPTHGPQLFARIEREVDELVRTAKGADVESVVTLVLEAMQSGASFDRALFGLVSPDRSTVQGRLALGAGAEELKASFDVHIGKDGGPLGMALSRQQDLVLRADRDLRPEEADQLRRFDVHLLGVMPLAWRGTLLGCLYYDAVDAVNAPTPTVEAGLRRLRDRCVQMLSRKK